MNIAIIRAFIALKQFALNYKGLAEQIRELQETAGNHHAQLDQIYAVLEKLLHHKEASEKWAERERIGFKNSQ